MQFTLLTPHRKIVENERVDEIFVPGSAGQLNILENHANFVTAVETGIIKWRVGANWTTAVVTMGLLEIFDGQVTVTADVSELNHEIDLVRARNAEKKARLKIDEGGLDDENFRKYELKLERALARIQLGSGN